MSRPGPQPGRGTAPTLPRVAFDPEVDLSPYTLFRRLREGRPPVLYHLEGDELRAGDAAPRSTLRGARVLGRKRMAEGWTPSPGQEAVLFDRDGVEARAAVVDLKRRGVTGVRALFGGLRLYDYALDPRVVGEERYLGPEPEPTPDVAPADG